MSFNKLDLAPIIIFAYKRIDHLKLLIESLKKNQECPHSELIIYSDGPKNDDEVKKIIQVRSFLKSITGFKKIEIIERESNIGLSNSIISGVSETLSYKNKAIILEDDLVVSSLLLKYMNSALNLYEFNLNVASIHAYSYPVKGSLPDYFFLRGADCWGWATWKDRWDLLNTDSKDLLKKIQESNLKNRFNFDGSHDFYQMLLDNALEKNDSWAIRWHASMFLENKLTLYPGTSFAKNIGNDGSGTHSESSNSFDTSLSEELLHMKNIDVCESQVAYQLFKSFFLSRLSFFSKLKSKIKNLYDL